MADNITLNSGSGGASLATDDVSGVQYQRVKMTYGTDGSATDVSDTNPMPIDDAGGSLTVDNAGTFATQVDGAALTALQLIDDIVFTDDGDWTATSSKHALVGGIYQSTPGTITDGDTGPIRLDANGAVHINDGGNSITVDGTVTANPASGTIDTVTTVTAVTDITNTIDATISGDALTALQLIDDAVHTDDSAFTLGTGKGVMMMGFAGTQSVNANDAAALACDTDGALHISDGGNSITVDGTVTANPASGTIDTVTTVTAVTDITNTIDSTISGDALTALQLIDDIVYTDDGDWTATSSKHSLIGGVYQSTPGTITDGDTGPIRLDANGAVHINDGGNSITVDGTITANAGTGTFTVDGSGVTQPVSGTVTANAGSGTFTVDLGANNDIQGDVAHDGVDSGNPIKIGAKVETSLKGITAAADADRTDLYADADGVQIVKIGTTGADLVHERVSNTDGASTAFTNFSAVASTYNYVTALTITNTSSTDGYVDIRDGAAGSVLWTVPIPANGGATICCGGTPLFKSSANTALAYDVSAALTTVYISMSGYQSKV